MNIKTCPVTIKAAGPNEGTDEGVFEAYVAAYNVDSVGDRIVPGAFKKSLDDWKARGNPIPVLWAHKSDDPDYHIGHVLEAEERPEGLWVKARIDIDDPSSKSAKVYKLLKGRRVTQFSFAYDEIDARPAQKDGSGATKELHELKIYEVGPCLIGANQQTSLLGVKQDPTTAVSVHIDGKPYDTQIKELVEARLAKHDIELRRSLSGEHRVSTTAQAQKIADDVLASLKSDPAPGQVCASCGEQGHLFCFDEKADTTTKTSDVVAALKDGRALSKEHIEALTGLLVDIAGKAEHLGDILDVLAGPETDSDAGEKATPAQPAADPAAKATVDAPARHGTASATPFTELTRLAFMEAELAVDDL